MGIVFVLKSLALWRETGRSSSLVAGNMERVDCRAGRVGISGSKKLKLKVGDFGEGDLGAAGTLMLTNESDSGLTTLTGPAGAGSSKALFPISSGN